MGPRAPRPPQGAAVPDDDARPAHAARAEVHLPVAAEVAWALVTDVRNHARWIPHTRIDAAHPLAAGDPFVAVTGPFATRGRAGPGSRAGFVDRMALAERMALVDRIALVDRMVVTTSEPPTTSPPHPGRAGYRKLGPVLLGGAEVVVAPAGPGGCTVTWYEAIHLRGLPARLVAPVARPLTGAMLRHALRRLAAEVRAANVQTEDGAR